MAYFDMPFDQLVAYKPSRKEPADFDLFWQSTLEETRKFSLDPQFNIIENELKTVVTYDVTFNGFGGQPIKGWFSLPAKSDGPLPCIIEFIGYGGGRGFPLDWLVWPSAGYAHFVMDTRGQGSTWRKGDTPDIGSGSNPAIPGFMTQGILDPATYYYRRLFADAVRAVETACGHPAVDPSRLAVTGGSQGGGISIAAVALVPEVGVLMADVPFLCHFRRAMEITDAFPYQEIVAYCKTHRDKVETVFNTLAYFDGVNFAPRINARSLFSVGLMDDTCPPSTVYAAYNYLTCEKEIRVYQFNRHEGGENFQTVEKLKFIKALWKLD